MTEQLLDLQALDTRLDQLAHRREHLPALLEQRELVTRRAAVGADRDAQGRRRDELARDERRLENEAEVLAEKVHAVERSMAASTSPKDLVAMQHEVDTLRGMQRSLEDQALELMEQLEPVDTTLAALDAQLAALEADSERVAASLEAELAEVEGDISSTTAERAAMTADMDGTLLETYELLRTQLGGVAVARFEGGRCGGCHLALSAVEADHLRHAPADEQVRCPECGRLLVR